MGQENAIDVRDLRISYKCLKSFSIKRSLLQLKKTKTEVFEAVRGISFSVPEGEILGIVGKNGSGKSTTLRALEGIFSPDSGTIAPPGDSVSLLTLGARLQQKLHGRA